jgi:hypothetical protein
MTTMTSLAGTAYSATYNGGATYPYFDAAAGTYYSGESTLNIVAWASESSVSNQSDFLPGATVTQGKITLTVNAAVDGGVLWTTAASVAQICGDTADWGSA